MRGHVAFKVPLTAEADAAAERAKAIFGEGCRAGRRVGVLRASRRRILGHQATSLCILLSWLVAEAHEPVDKEEVVGQNDEVKSCRLAEMTC